jgi:hypothetical protein
MPNIQINYLYRDSANYKNFNSIIFENDLSISIEELQILIKSKLIYDVWFYADQWWKLPELFSSFFDYKIAPTWHEFESFEYTEEAPSSILIFTEFI